MAIPKGLALAVGHPLGCSGVKLPATILREMHRAQQRYGRVTTGKLDLGPQMNADGRR